MQKLTQRSDTWTLSCQYDVLEKSISILDILKDYPNCNLFSAAYVDMLKPLSPRQYSISSSPLASIAVLEQDSHGPKIARITFDVHEGPARSGKDRNFQGVTSTYLTTHPLNNKLRCFVRPTNTSFHLRKYHETTVVMICAETGIAPMRGFIEERAQIAAVGNRKVGKALLYFGCRHFENVFLYAQQLKE